MINEKLIEKYKTFYKYDSLKEHLIKEDKISLIKKYKDLYEFIPEKEMDKMVNELIQSIPKDYINYYKNKSIDELNTYELFSTISRKKEENIEFIYFDKSILINESLGQLLLKSNENNKNNILKSKINYLYQNKQLYIIYKNFINIGILNDNIFKPEIIINNSSNETPENIINKIESYKYIYKGEINMIGDNVGKFNNLNTFILFLNKNNNVLKNIINSYKTNTFPTNNPQNILRNSQDIYIKNINNSTLFFKKEDFDKYNQSNLFFKKKSLDKYNKSNQNYFFEKKLGQDNSIKMTNAEQKKELTNVQDNSIKIINKQQKKELINVISVLIDLEKIKTKMSCPLNQNKNYSEIYYILNYEWFKKYIDLNNITEVFNFLLNNNMVQDIININNSFDNKKIIEKIVLRIKGEDLKNIKKDKDHYSELKNEQLFLPKIGKFIKNKDYKLKYYNNFLLLSQEIIELFNDEFTFNSRTNLVQCILGDNRVIIKYEGNYQYILEIYKIKENTNYILIPELFLDY